MTTRRKVTNGIPEVGDLIYVDDVFTGYKRNYPHNYLVLQLRTINPHDAYEYQYESQKRYHVWTQVLTSETGEIDYIHYANLRYFSIE